MTGPCCTKRESVRVCSFPAPPPLHHYLGPTGVKASGTRAGDGIRTRVPSLGNVSDGALTSAVAGQPSAPTLADGPGRTRPRDGRAMERRGRSAAGSAAEVSLECREGDDVFGSAGGSLGGHHVAERGNG